MPLDKIDKISSIIANLAVIFGVGIAAWAGYIAYQQYDFTRIQNDERLSINAEAELKRVTIETLKNANSSSFIKSYARLKTIYWQIEKKEIDKKELLCRLYGDEKHIKNCDAVVDDLNLVMLNYNYMAMLHNNKLVDSQILYSAIYQDIRTFSKIIDLIANEFKIQIDKHYFNLMLGDFIKKDWSKERKYRERKEDGYAILLFKEEVVNE